MGNLDNHPLHLHEPVVPKKLPYFPDEIEEIAQDGKPRYFNYLSCNSMISPVLI